MFISNTEKVQLRKDLDQMSRLFKDMNNDMIYLIARVKVLEGAKQEDKKPRKKHTMSPETRAKMSQMMKERHAKYKEEKQNATSVSTTSI
jgi:shikimate kinase